MPTLTPSGEVAVFVDDNQFGPFQSVDKCGPEAVAVFYHSVAPGQHNPYTSADIHLMAHDDYVKFMGPDVASDHNGTSDQQLYAMLQEYGFHYEPGPNDINWVKGKLNEGLVVIIGIVESSVLDGGVNPYNWNPAGLTHIICATGAGNAGEILVRDTANIDHNGIVRPGPRHYDSNKLQLVSATAVTPSWLNTPPPPTPAPAAAQDKAAWLEMIWNSTTAFPAGGNALAEAGIFPTGKTPPYTTGIAKAWGQEGWANHYYGPPLTYEYGYNGSVFQMFAGGWCEWTSDGQAHWYSWQ